MYKAYTCHLRPWVSSMDNRAVQKPHGLNVKESAAISAWERACLQARSQGGGAPGAYAPPPPQAQATPKKGLN